MMLPFSFLILVICILFNKLAFINFSEFLKESDFVLIFSSCFFFLFHWILFWFLLMFWLTLDLIYSLYNFLRPRLLMWFISSYEILLFSALFPPKYYCLLGISYILIRCVFIFIWFKLFSNFPFDTFFDPWVILKYVA